MQMLLFPEEASETLQERFSAAIQKRLSPEKFAPEYIHQWKEIETPGGRKIMKLAARADKRPFMGWPSPARQNADAGPNPLGNTGEHFTLQTAAELSGWPSPAGQCDSKGACNASVNRREGSKAHSGTTLTDAALLAGWATPAHHEFELKDVERMLERREEVKAQGINGNGFGLTLGMMVHLCGWATPQTHDCKGAKTEEEIQRQRDKGAGVSNLNEMVMLAGWASPKKGDDGSSGQESLESKMERGSGGVNLIEMAMLAGWATANARDWKAEIPPEEWLREGQGQPLSRMVLGMSSTSSIVKTKNCGGSVLNAAMSRWLMGFPQSEMTHGWDTCSPGWKEWVLIQRLLAEYSKPQEPTASEGSEPTETQS